MRPKLKGSRLGSIQVLSQHVNGKQVFGMISFADMRWAGKGLKITVYRMSLIPMKTKN